MKFLSQHALLAHRLYFLSEEQLCDFFLWVFFFLFLFFGNVSVFIISSLCSSALVIDIKENI